jgi:histidine triad (HIT) family protein
VFCERIANRDYDDIDRDVASFVPLNPVVPGHRLFVPSEHVIDLMHKPWISAMTFGVAATYAAALNWPCNLITSAGAEATQSVFHLHVHYIPRREGDGLALPWTGQ